MNNTDTITALTTDDRKPGKAEIAKSAPVRIPPFAATCRAAAVANTKQYSRCLVDVSVMCGYRATAFNLGNFCLHPRHADIVAQTAG